MTTTRLMDIADICAGYLFTKGIQHTSTSPYRALQLKDITETGEIKTPSIGVKLPSEPKAKYLLKKDDVLFLAKAKLQAIHIKEDLKNTIATSQFFLIRPKTNKIDSNYLVWFLNQPPAKKFLAKHTEGTGILGIKLRNLNELPIIVLPEEKRNTLLSLDRLQTRYQALNKELVAKRNQLMNLISNHIFRI